MMINNLKVFALSLAFFTYAFGITAELLIVLESVKYGSITGIGLFVSL